MAKPAAGLEWSKTAIRYIEKFALQLHLNQYTHRPDNDATRRGMRHEERALQEFSKLAETGMK
ncbi:MAG: hypothetical protein ABII90_08575 [Bacteroidota bacterium]